MAKVKKSKIIARNQTDLEQLVTSNISLITKKQQKAQKSKKKYTFLAIKGLPDFIVIDKIRYYLDYSDVGIKGDFICSECKELSKCFYIKLKRHANFKGMKAYATQCKNCKAKAIQLA
jgi:hypothetical protein